MQRVTFSDWSRKSAEDRLREEVRTTLLELERAYENFSNAEPNFVDAALAAIDAASLKLSALIRAVREGGSDEE